ncbi:MAG TPA: cytochrome c maturation protein CcmE [Polyangiaceae bacterium]
MSRVDDELAAAVRESEEVAQAEPAPTAPAPLIRPVKKGSVGLLVALLVVGAAILTLVFTSGKDATIYARQVDELVRERDKLAGRAVRVEGALKRGSLTRRAEPCEYRFTLSKAGTELPVRFAQCIVPDTFRDMPGMDVMVTAEGKLDPAGHFEATNIMAKCPSKYEMNERAKKGENAPHTGVVAPVSPKI